MNVEQPAPVGFGASLPWHEAVALVRAVTDAVTDGRMRSVPTLDELLLNSDGSLHVTATATGRRAADGPQLVTELCQLLGQLLDTSAPLQLRTFAEGEQSIGNLARFSEALVFFERPSKERDLQALAVRLRQYQEKRQLEAEMERVTQKTRTNEQAPDVFAPAAPALPRRNSWKSRILLVAAISLVAMAVILLGIAALRSSTSTSGPGASESKAPGVLATLRSVAKAALETYAPAAKVPEAPPAAASGVVAAPKSVRHAAKLRVRSDRQALRPRGIEIFRASEPEVVEVPVSAVLPAVPPVHLQPSTNAVYDGGNPDVIPARLIRPHVTTVTPQVFSGGRGELEVLVGENGLVEQVRLIATTAERRYYDMMILSAVKAWVFRPATRGGQRVRYRVQIPLT